MLVNLMENNVSSEQYHSNFLIIKIHPSAGPLLQLADNPSKRGTDIDILSDSPGIRLLAEYGKASLIKNVIPVSPKFTTGIYSKSEVRPLTLLAETSLLSYQEEISAGVSLIEFYSSDDMQVLLDTLNVDPNIDFASKVPIRYFLNDLVSNSDIGDSPLSMPPHVNTLWNLQRIKWLQARQLSHFADASHIKVAVLDTGIQSEHPDLSGMVRYYRFDYPEDSVLKNSDKDIVGHGTHVSGIISANINNKLGINGLCSTNLMVWKIFDDIPDKDIVRRQFVFQVNAILYYRALEECIKAEVDIINLSIGGTAPPDPQEKRLYNTLLNNGTSVVAAMGNSKQDGNPIIYPAAIPGVIAIGASRIDDTLAQFSSTGSHISICAPGDAIWSTLPTYPGVQYYTAVTTSAGMVSGKPILRDTNYGIMSGTSMAAPHVAGAIALLFATHGKGSSQDVKDYLMRTADKVPQMGGANFTFEFGAGRLNLYRLLL